jgi:hypothetical protein
VLLTTLLCAALPLLAGGVEAFPATSARSPTVDAVVSAAAKGRTSKLTSPRLQTHGSHDLVLAFVFAAGPASGGQRVSRVSGDGLHWSLVARGDGANGAAEVWQAHATRQLKGSIAAALRVAGYPASITVAAFGGSSPYVEAHATSQGHASAPTTTLAPAAGSLLWAVGHSAGQKTRTTPLAGQHFVYQFFDRRSHTGGWVQQATPTSSGTARVVDNASSGRWGLAAVAIASPNLTRARADQAQAVEAADAASTGPASTGPGCTPSPAFTVGVEDDPVFLGRNPAMSPSQGFDLASSAFSAHLLRLDVIWGEVQMYGWAPYDQAVQMARDRCWTVQMTIMPTPTYAESYLDDALSTKNLDLRVLASFASEIATRYAGQVQRYSIGNEPNVTKFLQRAGSMAADMAVYDQMYMVGYDAVKAADPTAQVIAGELAGSHIIEWLENVDGLPSDGIAIHPYALTEQTGLFASLIHHPLLVSEDGVQASHPNQLAEDLNLEAWARSGGATEIVFYQLSRTDSSEGAPWNTGIQ